MVVIFCNKYKRKIKNNEITLDEAINLAYIEVPDKWRNDVIKELEKLR